MTDQEAIITVLAAGAVITATFMAAQRRWQSRGLLLCAAVLGPVLAAVLVTHNARTPGPSAHRAAVAAIPLTAVAAGSVVVLMLGRVCRPLLIAVLTWSAVVFAFFETAYLLKP